MDSTPKDDTTQNKIPPLHARLFWYVLSSAEMSLLKAMVEHCWDGSVIWASVARLSAYSKLTERTVQNLIHGWVDSRTKRRNPGLVERGILTEKAKANPSKRRPVTYQLNEMALVEDPKMIPYRERELQEVLPGIDLAAVPGQPVRPRQKPLPGVYGPSKPRQNKLPGLSSTTGQAPLVQPFHQSPATVSPVPLVQPLHQSGETVAPNYLIDSRRGESVEGVGCFPAVEIVKKKEIPSSTDFPLELAQGLRDLVPDIDTAAIRQIYQTCKTAADDCTVEEILHFADTKAFYLSKATNPTGFLIHAVTMSVTPEAVMALRDRRQREERQREFEAQERRRLELEGMARMEQYRRQEELERQAATVLDGWPQDKQTELKEQVAQELFSKTPEARMWPSLKHQIRLLMVRRVAESLSQPASMV
jgi:hypothetical protein